MGASVDDTRRVLPPRLAAVSAAALVVVGLRYTVLALGDVGAFVVGRSRASALVVTAIELFVALVALGVGARLIRRTRARVARVTLLAVAVVYLGGGYAVSLLERRAGSFAGLATYPPHETFHDDAPGRPPLSYRSNALGFREPEIAREKPAGATRIALIGDSYVFGMGVPLDGTLSAHLAGELARRGRRADVLNLGFPGHNLTSHVALYAAAGRELHADVAVVCLTMPNDLSRWDGQDERRAAAQPSLYSLSRYALGSQLTGALWGERLLAEEVTPEGLAHLDHETARLAALARARDAPALYLFSFQPDDAVIDARLRAVAGAHRIPTPMPRAGDFLPHDGHPTSAGNGHFAAAIADAVFPAR